MTTQPNDTAVQTDMVLDDRGYALLTVTAQQAVLPRKLDEGIYATLNEEGGIEVGETIGYRLQREHDWERARADKPEFVHRAPTLLDVDSFIDYLSHNTSGEVEDGEVGEGYRHNAGALEVWASIDDRKVTAILDGYNGLRKHTATLALKTSREWNEWLAIDGKLVNQVEFAQFIEDHISTIAMPDGGRLVDICETLTGNTGVTWKSQNLNTNGQRKFVYEEVIEAKAGAKGDLDIPTELVLVLRPFQGSEPQSIAARFRFRLSEGQLRMGVKLAEPERVLEYAFDGIVEDLQERVPVHINHGRSA